MQLMEANMASVKGADVHPSVLYVAFEEFSIDTKKLFELSFEGSETRPIVVEQQRYAVAMTLLMRFLVEMDKKELARHFAVLAEALQDLSVGTSNPLFTMPAMSKKGGRPPVTNTKWRLRANLCAGVRALEKAGVPIKQSIAAIAREHRESFAKLTRTNNDLSTSLQFWLDAFATDAVSNVLASRLYKTHMRQLEIARMVLPDQELKKRGDALILRAVGEARRVLL